VGRALPASGLENDRTKTSSYQGVGKWSHKITKGKVPLDKKSKKKPATRSKTRNGGPSGGPAGLDSEKKQPGWKTSPFSKPLGREVLKGDVWVSAGLIEESTAG